MGSKNESLTNLENQMEKNNESTQINENIENLKKHIKLIKMTNRKKQIKT